MFTEFDRLAMTRALALAERGFETTHPNPRVGCVIAKGERIIAEGWHERAGQAHAEVAALRSAKEPVAGATAYVTLEPCSHFGRTPPCVNALIEARIARVVFAVQDPNPRVSGQGADALLRAGIAVEAGLMEAEATEVNIGFMKRMKHGLPWVRVKLAMSLDGRTALSNGASQWITGESARNDVQRWRARCSAVMTGVGTVLADDPQLNVRTVGFKGRQPLRVVLDSRLRSPPGAKMFVGLGAAAVGASGGAGVAPAAAGAVGLGVQGVGDVLIFAAAGGGIHTASSASSVALTEPADLADDIAALVNAFETSPTAVAAHSADVAGPASVKVSSKADAPSSTGAFGAAPSGAAAKGAAAATPPSAAAKGAAGAPGGSPSDDATWAGATLSGAVPVQPVQPRAPAVATGSPLSNPGSPGSAVRDPSGQAAHVSVLAGTSTMPSSTSAAGAGAAPAVAAAPATASGLAAPVPIAAAPVIAAAAPTSASASAPGLPPSTLAGAAAPTPSAAGAPASSALVTAPGLPPSTLAGVSAPAPSAAGAPASSALATAARSSGAAPDADAAPAVSAAPASSVQPIAPVTSPGSNGAAPVSAATMGPAAGPATAATASASTSATGHRPPADAAAAGAITAAPPTKTSPKADSPAAFQARRAALAARGVRIEEVPADDGFLDLFAVLQKLAELEVNEVLVEAGPTLAGQLLTTFFVDELLLYIAPKLLGPQGRPLVNLPELQSLQDAWGFGLFDAKKFGEDLRLRLRPK